MLDLLERKKDEAERLTVAIAQGFAISMSPEAAVQWLAEHGGAGKPPIAASVLGQMMTQFPGSFRINRAN